MINPFERFYDTEIEVYEVGENTYEKKGEKTLLGSVVCDIQPYENELENRIYGLTENKKYKVVGLRKEEEGIFLIIKHYE